MKFAADLHIHSHFSMATSKSCNPDTLSYYAAMKGITVLGTGDCTHPGWRAELREALVEAEGGLYRLSDERVRQLLSADPRVDVSHVRFVVTGEISCIYKRHGRTRKVHNLLILPSLEAADRIAEALDEVGNIRADGRPILGLDSYDLLRTCLDRCPEAVFVPAHIWTPHFSMLGANSGFDSVEECFGDLSRHIVAVETGLSSDPPMNWRVSALDRFALISNSDAHSPGNLAREANLFDCDLSFTGIRRSLSGEDRSGLVGTLEFFPEEGKYHYDGHRSCGIRWSPTETREHDGICPICGKRVTLGVLHRVEMLADRAPGLRPGNSKRYESLVPLADIISAALGASPTGAKAQRLYRQLVMAFGSELTVVREVGLADIRSEVGELVAEGVRRVREGDIEIRPGYDGQYGTVSVIGQKDRTGTSLQAELFPPSETLQTEGARGGAEPSRSDPARLVLTVQLDPARRDIVVEEPEPRLSPPSPRRWGKGRHAGDSVGPANGSVCPAGDSVSLAGGVQTDSEADDVANQGRDGSNSISLFVDVDASGAVVMLQESCAQEVDPEVDLEADRPSNMGSEQDLFGLYGKPSTDPLAELNEDQLRAVTEVHGPVIVVAGPGTGKTKTLTSRISYLIKAIGVPAERITAITFTNKAAGEIAERVRRQLDADGPRRLPLGLPHIGTFHAICLQILRTQDKYRDLTIASEKDSLSVLAEVMPAKTRLSEIRETRRRISLLKGMGITASSSGVPDDLVDIFQGYQALLSHYGAMDYDDIPLAALNLCRGNAQVASVASEWSSHLLVDEFQDVNEVQYELIKALSGDGKNLFVIGDPDQSIYGFRGASPRFFEQLARDYEGSSVINLVTNYRSVGTVIEAANAVIASNRSETRLPLEGIYGRGDAIAEIEAQSELSEGIAITQEIGSLVGGTDMISAHLRPNNYGSSSYSFSDIAVLFRTGRQADAIEKCLVKAGIPYRVVGQRGILEDEGVASLLNLASVVAQPGKLLAWLHCLSAPQFKVSSEVWRIVRESCAEGAMVSDVLQQLIDQDSLTADEGRAVDKLLRLYRRYAPGVSSCSPESLLRSLADECGIEQTQSVKRLLAHASGYANVGQLLYDSALGNDADWSRNGDVCKGPEAVSLMTIHAAKGLEFPVVFVAGMEEGVLPLVHDGGEPDIEEERRLFFVAMTRARQRLYLSYVKGVRPGRGRRPGQRSRFVGDIPGQLISRIVCEPKKRARESDDYPSLF